MSGRNGGLIEFPCKFPLKVMGEGHPDFVGEVLNAVRVHAPDTHEGHVTVKPSSGGNYVSATVTVYAESQEQLDNIYRALTSHPMVKVVF